MNCRPGCGACCIAPSISTLIPGMPLVNGVSKPAGVRCVQLTVDNACAIFGQPERPAVCASLKPATEMCGDNREHALHWLHQMERSTAP
jgi:Fe-S-cluster containining protein